MVLTHINGESVGGIEFQDVWWKLAATTRPMVVTFGRSATNAAKGVPVIRGRPVEGPVR